VTIGIKPERPETGYGYIKVRQQEKIGYEMLYKVDRFIEKPKLTMAQQYLNEGGYYWNAGIFAMKAKTILRALEKNAPLIFQRITNINFDHDLSAEIAREYKMIKAEKQNISIDYAVMEKEANDLLLIPADETLAWNDVGGWVALAKYIPVQPHNNLIFNYLNLDIQIAGPADLLVITSANGILITSQELAPRAREIIPGIEAQKTTEMIDCRDTRIENRTTLYLGAIGLEQINISFDGKKLNITR